MGEPTVKIESFTILAKALRPPPAKWHGLEDTEIRYRQRYLDLMANDEVKKVFLMRSAVIREIRSFLHSRGYVEVETPMMQAIPGGAAAQPFKTWHNALGCDFYLRIALELPLKRMLVGGVDKVFEIGRVFRNEGLSRKHNPEFTMLEAYEAFGDYETMMELVQSMICQLAEKVTGSLLIPRDTRSDVQNAIRSALDILSWLADKTRILVLEEAPLPKTKALVKKLTTEVNNLYPNLKACISRLESTPPDVVAEQAWTLTAFAMVELQAVRNEIFEDAELRGEAVYKVLQQFGRTHNTLKRLSDPKSRFIDLTPNWKRQRYKDLVRSEVKGLTGDQDWFALTPAERRAIAVEELKLGGEIADKYEDFEITGAVFEKLIEPTLTDPTFVTHLPKELVPLAKLSPDDPTCVEVFECCINGQEIAPAYSEQNDPIEQRERLEHQAGGEQQKLDEDFLVALEHGMPPAGGMGLGIDRLCMMLLGQESIRDVILFPQLKPK
jgi:lysyl-tRNA synthetase class 2